MKAIEFLMNNYLQNKSQTWEKETINYADSYSLHMLRLNESYIFIYGNRANIGPSIRIAPIEIISYWVNNTDMHREV